MIDPQTNEEIDLNTAYWRRTIADRIKQQINIAAIESQREGFRDHLGASVIGHNCQRYLLYHFRWFKREIHSAQTYRIFEKGRQSEAEMRSVLISRGCKFVDTVDIDGKQTRVSDIDGHFGGSVDGIFVWPELGITEPMLWENKSSRTGTPFTDLEKKGVMAAKPQYFIQQSVYGYKLNIPYACYITINKNDSDIFVEIVDLDFTLAQEQIAKARHLITIQTLPPRISERRNYFECNYCIMQDICHDGVRPVPNCRNCANAVPVQNGEWYCNHWNQIIPKEAIIKGCPEHKLFG